MNAPIKIIAALWALLAILWGLYSLYDSKPAIRTQTPHSRLLQTAVLICGFVLLYRRTTGITWLDLRVIPQWPLYAWAGAAAVFVGVAFAAWARVLLGANWSGTATVKAGHTLICRGPYRMVRHPIYTGILTGVLGTAVVNGTLHALLAVPLCGLSYWMKIQT